MARPTNHHDSSPSIGRPARRYGWISDAFGAAYQVFDSPQMASASALLGAASRLIFTGSGPGSDAAAFGATVFAEAGCEALHCHAGDLTTGSVRLQPGDLVIGIDSESTTVASALRRARHAGLHTVGVTNRELTIIDADVLLFVPPEAGYEGPVTPSSTLAFCLTLALLAARLEPETVMASEVAAIERSVHRVTSASGRVMASILFGAGGDKRIVFAGRGVSNWVARTMAHSLNSRTARSTATHAVHADLHDIVEGFWTFDPADILVQIDSYTKAPSLPNPLRHAEKGHAPHQVWTYTPQHTTSRSTIHLPSQSPALGALIAFAALSSLLAFANDASLPAL